MVLEEDGDAMWALVDMVIGFWGWAESAYVKFVTIEVYAGSRQKPADKYFCEELLLLCGEGLQ